MPHCIIRALTRSPERRLSRHWTKLWSILLYLLAAAQGIHQLETRKWRPKIFLSFLRLFSAFSTRIKHPHTVYGTPSLKPSADLYGGRRQDMVILHPRQQPTQIPTVILAPHFGRISISVDRLPHRNLMLKATSGLLRFLLFQDSGQNKINHTVITRPSIFLRSRGVVPLVSYCTVFRVVIASHPARRCQCGAMVNW